MLSRAKPATGPGAGPVAKQKEKKKMPKLEDFLSARDYTGAITLLEVLYTFHDFTFNVVKYSQKDVNTDQRPNYCLDNFIFIAIISFKSSLIATVAKAMKKRTCGQHTVPFILVTTNERWR